MKVIPLASDSMGVRSLSVLVEIDGSNSILIDGGVRLGPKRYGLAPTNLEMEALKNYELVVQKALHGANMVIVSHYHYDHYFPDSTEYGGKTLFVKDPNSNINASQRTRGGLFTALQEEDSKVIVADGKEFTIDDITMRFSEPVPHGIEDSPLGFVLMTELHDERSGETLLHTSDVQGPVSMRTTEKIIDVNPDILILDGAPTYLQDWREPFVMERVQDNLIKILDSVKGTVIMDHHHLRDQDWRHIYSRAVKDREILNFAKYNGLEATMLESRRKDIWRSEHGED